MAGAHFDLGAFLRDISADYGSRVATRTLSGLRECSFCREGVSPIETLMGAALYIEMLDRISPEEGIDVGGFCRHTNLLWKSLPLAPFGGFYGFHQVKIGPYTADFVIVLQDRYGARYFAIECDGHDFHEKTKFQAQHDKARDRYMQSLGVIVFRYTGSEIWHDARAAACSALDNCSASFAVQATGR